MKNYEPANSWPKISIVTPSYNQSAFLESTIDSILSQNYPNLEYIIIDGGSSDESVEIIKKYKTHLHFWCSEPDSGQYDAICKGFNRSSGEIMAWLNSDDKYCPWALSTVGSIMREHSTVEWLTSLNPILWDYAGLCLEVKSISGYSRTAFLDGSYLPGDERPFLGWIQQESTFWRRSLWEKTGTGVLSKYTLAGDFHLWSSFFEHADLYGITCPLGGFRVQTNQRSKDLSTYLCEAEDSLRTARQNMRWKKSIPRDLLYRLKADKLPRINQLFSNAYGHKAKKIVRRNPDTPWASWSIEDYRFV